MVIEQTQAEDMGLGVAFELRPYQQKAVRQVLEETLVKDNRVFLQLATGAGKTVIMAELMRLVLENLDMTAGNAGEADEGVIFMCHRKELVEQAKRTFRMYGLPVWMSTDVAASKPAHMQYRRGYVNIQTAQKLAGRKRPLPPFRSFLFVDEGHHAPSASWKRVLSGWAGHVLLVSATPYRNNKREHFLDIADVLVQGRDFGASLEELVDAGHLRTPMVQVPNRLIKYLNADVLAGEVSMGRMISRRGMEIALTEIPVEEYISRCTWKGTGLYPLKGLVFAATQDIALRQVKLLQEEGIRAGALLSDEDLRVRHGLGKWDVSREIVRQRFEDGELDVIVNCGIVSEGFDVPAVDTVIIGRPTLSLSLYKQMIGRSMRPHIDEASGRMKDKSLIVDCGGSLYNPDIGHPLHEPDWSLHPRTSVPATTPPIMKRCPSCGTSNFSAIHNCVFCRASFGRVCSHCGIWRSHNQFISRDEEEICNLSKRELHEQKRELERQAGEKHYLVATQNAEYPRLHLLDDATEEAIRRIQETYTKNRRASGFGLRERMDEGYFGFQIRVGRKVNAALKANQKEEVWAGKVLPAVFAPPKYYWKREDDFEQIVDEKDIEKHSKRLVALGNIWDIGEYGIWECDWVHGNDRVCSECGSVHELMTKRALCSRWLAGEGDEVETTAVETTAVETKAVETTAEFDPLEPIVINGYKITGGAYDFGDNNLLLVDGWAPRDDGAYLKPRLTYAKQMTDKRTGVTRMYRGLSKFHELGCWMPILMPPLFETSPYMRKEVETLEEKEKAEAVQADMFANL